MIPATTLLGAELPPGIFIVEDEAVVAKDIANTLRDLGYRVLGCAANGTAALLGATRLKPDLILMDIGLPGSIDGVAAAAAIRDKTSIPVVFLSALFDPETLARAGRTDPFGYVVKPFKQADLRSVIEIALRRCRMQAIASEREHLLVMTLLSMGDGVVTTNEKEEVTFLNPAGERLTGWSLADATGRQLTEVMPLRNEVTGEPVAPLRLALAERRTTTLPKGTLLVGRLHTVAIDDSAAPIGDAVSLLGGVVVFRDASEKQLLEEQLRCYQKMEVVGQLTSAIAHDFNNVLSAILLCSRFLAESLAADDPRRLDAAEIENAAKRGAALTRQLLTFGRPQALEPATLNLNEVVGELKPMLGRLLGGDIAFSVEGSPDLGCVTADRGQIEQVIVNLVINARDAMPCGGTLRVETSNIDLGPEDLIGHPNLLPGRHVMLAIGDTGCGMDAETQKHALEPFFTTKGKTKGTGLGLSSSYEIVMHSGGDIRLFSEPGRGAVFRIYLPRAGGRPSLYPLELAAQQVGDETETILLVESDAVVREALARTLESFGYRVLRSPDEAQACASADSHQGPIHLLLSDMMAAHGTGGPVPLAELRTRVSKARMLFMSGYADNDSGASDTATTGSSFIQKPFSSDALARKVRAVLGG